MREIVSLQVHTGYLTFSLQKNPELVYIPLSSVAFIIEKMCLTIPQLVGLFAFLLLKAWRSLLSNSHRTSAVLVICSD